ncbi:MAG: hypothetical protein BWX48_01066 [Verrucomicrobia bacterium ADurb.Bin006]|nr:MAG: hypothetical protein BWX48_01066 [Verrucomicrobia bacterium ADurb.Bin006]
MGRQYNKREKRRRRERYLKRNRAKTRQPSKKAVAVSNAPAPESPAT